MNLRLALCLVFALAFVATARGDCGDNVEDLVNELTAFQARLASCSTEGAICDANSDCREAIRDYFDFVEECTEQIAGSNVDFATLLNFYENLIETSCDLSPGDLADQLFAVCSNHDDLVSASSNVLTACPTSQGICSDDCTDALARYYKELFACFSPTNDADIESLRAIYETRCELVSAGQSCTQVAIANVHEINEKCANSDGFQCSSDCQNAIASAEATAASHCATGAADLFRQYASACTGECGSNLNSAWATLTEACDKLGDLDSNTDECVACTQAIDAAIESSSCLGTSAAASATLSLLKAIAAQACTPDLAAKDIAGNIDVFGSESRAVVTQCRASGLCTNECQDAIDAFVEDVKDAYSDLFLSLPSDVKDAVDDVSDICSAPFTGFPFRIRTVFGNINCAAVQSASFDYLFRLAQLFGLSPANLIIVDCFDIESTRDTSASLTLGSSSEPDNDVKASDCESVSLSCSEISTDQGDNSSPASAIFVNGLLVVAGVAFMMF